MTDYLDLQFDWHDPATLRIFDEAPLWSAMFGQMILERAPMQADCRLIDLACGAGFPLLDLAERLGPTCRAYGVDFWMQGLDQARFKITHRHVTNVTLVGGDGVAIPFASGSIDLIVSNLGVNNLADPGTVLAECARVLRPGGSLMLTTNLRGHMAEFYGVYRQFLRDEGRADLLDALQHHIDHRVTLDELRAQIAQAGLTVTEAAEQTFTMRFLDGSALLRHAFIRLAFLEAWVEFLPEGERRPIMAGLEAALNAYAAARGELALTIPGACVTAVRK
jgi:arsenite methyltransferase